MKTQSIPRQLLSLALMWSLLATVTISLTNCTGTDVIMEGLTVARDVVKVAQVSAGLDPQVSSLLTKVSGDLDIVIKTYADYEAAAPGDKPSKAVLVRATITAINANLGDILTAVGVKDPKIRVLVAVVNTALVAVMDHIVSKATTPAGITVTRPATPELPVIAGAKSAKDLKKAWNDAVAGNSALQLK